MAERPHRGYWLVETFIAVLGVAASVAAAFWVVSWQSQEDNNQRRAEALSDYQGTLVRYQYALESVQLGNDSDRAALLDDARNALIDATVSYQGASIYLDDEPNIRQCADYMRDRMLALSVPASMEEPGAEDIKQLFNYHHNGILFSPEYPAWESLEQIAYAVGAVRVGEPYPPIECVR